MPRIIDIEKEKVFIKTYAQTGNATHSARVCGYDSNPRQMGSYLKAKHKEEIETCIKSKIDSMSSQAINTVQELLGAKSDMVKLKAAEYILKMGGYGVGASIGSADHEQSEVRKELESKSDEELAKIICDNLKGQMKENSEFKKTFMKTFKELFI
jgi:phage terminase small subunit|tara:strand:- start:3454 stop:3918 length:465 start_codon:yes stop_codon:yes gene_type:complete